MKYNIREFNSAVEKYKKILGNIKGKSILIIIDFMFERAYYSTAPLGRAIHELGGDVNITVKYGKSEMLDALNEVLDTYSDMKKGAKNQKTKALNEFISCVKDDYFEKIFKRPDLIIEATKDGFSGDENLPYLDGWFKKHKWNELIKTSDNIWKNVYNLKNGERISCGFETIPTAGKLDLPLEDYLDSFPIVMAMAVAARKKAKVSMGASSPRFSTSDLPERIGELRATLLGCELTKNVNEKVFVKFKALSSLLNLSRIKPVDAAFFVHGKGYSGKHIFGEKTGYPSLDRKTRWPSPGSFIYKLDWYQQTKIDKRSPLARYGFTETLPIDIFIETCNVDWNSMRERNNKIIKIMEKCRIVKVSGEPQKNGIKTEFEVGLIKKNGEHRWARGSDSDTRNKINQIYYKRTGIKAGTMANLPGGEMFLTPEYLIGTFAGDVVISVDQSYILNSENPIIVKCSKKGYKILNGPKDIIKKIEKRKNDAWKTILRQEKNKSLPKAIIDSKKKNFQNIGEFAINTNPRAKLCRYLIVNEKIAKMIHIALGSGFEPDRNTDYHIDIVINSPKQKLDIYGTDSEGKKHWIIKKGEFCI